MRCLDSESSPIEVPCSMQEQQRRRRRRWRRRWTSH